MHTRNKADLAAMVAHTEKIGGDTMRTLIHIISKVDPETGLAYLSNRDIAQVITSQNAPAAFRSYKQLVEAGYIQQITDSEPAYRHPIYQGRAKTPQMVKAVRVTLNCNLLCSSAQHCPDPVYRTVLETHEIAESDLASTLDLIYSETPLFPEDVADCYKELLIESAPLSGGRNLIPGFYTQEELATGGGAYENLTKLAFLGLATITRSEGKEDDEGQLYKVLPVLPVADRVAS